MTRWRFTEITDLLKNRQKTVNRSAERSLKRLKKKKDSEVIAVFFF